MPGMTIAEFCTLKRWCDRPTGRVAFVDTGQGTAIVFLHGVPLNSLHWRGVVSALQARFRCVAPDLMGLGDTEPSDGAGLDFTSQAEMVLDLLDRLGLSQFHLVGNDSGGAIAQIVACRAPERVLTLTLTNCDVDANVPPPAFAQAYALAQAGLFGRAVAGMRDNLALARSDFGLGAGFENPEHITPELVEAYIGPLLESWHREQGLNTYVAAFDSVHTVDLRDRLSALEVPTQILWGADDVFFPLSDAHWLAQTIPGVRRLLTIEGARLFFCEERPDWVADRVAEFALGEIR